jgi:uncharacterized membrane protein YjjP (DUF1212 family)
MTSGVFIVLVLALFAGLLVMLVYEITALVTRKVPTVTEIVQTIILHFVPKELRPKVAAPTRLRTEALRDPP